MRRILLNMPLGIGLSLMSACSPDPTFKMVSSVEDVMEGIVIPASDKVFAVGAISVTKDGMRESVPEDDEAWSQVKHSAMVLAEAGNVLKFEARALEANWIKCSQALIDHATGLAAKADAKDTRAVFDAAAAMYEHACSACHAEYLTAEPTQ